MKKTKLLLIGASLCLGAICGAIIYSANLFWFVPFMVGAFVLSIMYFNEEK